MAVLTSDLVELEVRVLLASTYREVYALDLRWNGVPLLNPPLSRGLSGFEQK